MFLQDEDKCVYSLEMGLGVGQENFYGNCESLLF